jgi:hypothetical protein
MAIISVDINIEDYLIDVSDLDLTEELEDRGFYVSEKEEDYLENLTKEELDHLRDMVINGKPGSIEWSIYNKIKKV